VPFLKLNRMKGPVAGDVRTSNAIDPEKSTRGKKLIRTPILSLVVGQPVVSVLTDAGKVIVHLGHTGNVEQRDERLVRGCSVGELQRVG